MPVKHTTSQAVAHRNMRGKLEPVSVLDQRIAALCYSILSSQVLIWLQFVIRTIQKSPLLVTSEAKNQFLFGLFLKVIE